MWRNAPLQEQSGLDEHPLPTSVLLQQPVLPHAAATARSEEHRGARCHTGVPIPCPYQACRVGCPGTLHAAGTAQAACPPMLPTATPAQRSPASQAHSAKWVSSGEPAALGAAASFHSTARPWAGAVTQQQEEPNQN